jgi:hypothetical protein
MSFMNEGTADRVIRIVAGIVLLALGWGGVVDGTLGPSSSSSVSCPSPPA